MEDDGEARAEADHAGRPLGVGHARTNRCQHEMPENRSIGITGRLPASDHPGASPVAPAIPRLPRVCHSQSVCYSPSRSRDTPDMESQVYLNLLNRKEST